MEIIALKMRTKSAQKMDPKLMISCLGNHICLYSIPLYMVFLGSFTKRPLIRPTITQTSILAILQLEKLAFPKSISKLFPLKFQTGGFCLDSAGFLHG